MYIELIEELNVGFSTEPSLATEVNELAESDGQFNPTDSLYVPAEGVHSIITGNYTYYEPNCLKESVPLWTTPYGIPIIYHHKEHDSKIIGRIKKAEYVKESKRTNTPALRFLFAIGDQEGKEGVLNKTLKTLSIGARAKDLRCSICGKNIAREGFCEHEKGRYYDGKLCYWVVKRIEPKEISYVIVPSDKYAYSEEPITNQKEIALMTESSNEKEVNDLSNNIFEDVFSKALAESQENKIKKDAEEKAKLKEDPKPAEPEDKKPEPPAEPDPKPDQKKEPEEDPAKEQPEAKKPEEEPKGTDDDKDPKAEDDKPKEDPKQEDPKDEQDKDEHKEELKEIIKDMEDKIKHLTADVALFKKKYEEEKELRESAEQDKIKIESIVKHDLIEKINDLRTSFGLKEKDSELQMGTSLDILESEYNSLSEISSSSINCVKTIQQIKSSAIVDDKLDNTNKQNLKESEQDQVIDLDIMFSKFTKR